MENVQNTSFTQKIYISLHFFTGFSAGFYIFHMKEANKMEHVTPDKLWLCFKNENTNAL